MCTNKCTRSLLMLLLTQASKFYSSICYALHFTRAERRQFWPSPKGSCNVQNQCMADTHLDILMSVIWPCSKVIPHQGSPRLHEAHASATPCGSQVVNFLAEFSTTFRSFWRDRFLSVSPVTQIELKGFLVRDETDQWRKLFFFFKTYTSIKCARLINLSNQKNIK